MMEELKYYKRLIGDIYTCPLSLLKELQEEMANDIIYGRNRIAPDEFDEIRELRQKVITEIVDREAVA